MTDRLSRNYRLEAEGYAVAMPRLRERAERAEAALAGLRLDHIELLAEHRRAEWDLNSLKEQRRILHLDAEELRADLWVCIEALRTIAENRSGSELYLGDVAREALTRLTCGPVEETP
jgi:hypothetical protein